MLLTVYTIHKLLGLLQSAIILRVLKQSNSSSRAIGVINFEKHFSKFYRRHYELISKFNFRLKTLLHEGLSETEFYGGLV